MHWHGKETNHYQGEKVAEYKKSSHFCLKKKKRKEKEIMCKENGLKK
jgi:hypothetical protein